MCTWTLVLAAIIYALGQPFHGVLWFGVLCSIALGIAVAHMAYDELKAGYSTVWHLGEESRAVIVAVRKDEACQQACIIRYCFDVDGVTFLHQYRSWRHDAAQIKRGQALPIFFTQTPLGLRSIPT